jgi:hypothetical protein
MKLHFATRGAALALATTVAATGLAAPAAFGRIAPDPVEPALATTPTGLVRVLRIEAPAAPSSPGLVPSHSGAAFDWRDTGIAAGAGAAALALGVGVVVTRRRRTGVPDVPVLD